METQYPSKGILRIFVSEVLVAEAFTRNPMAHRLLLQWCLCLLTLSAYAQTPIQIGADFDEAVLSKQVEILEDSSKQLRINDILTQTNAFKPHQKAFINPGFTNSYFWVKFQLANPDSVTKQLILEVENPHINKLQLYALSQGQLWTSMLTGDHFPFAQRPIRHPHFLLPIVLTAHQTVTYYLWIDKHGEQLQIPLRLWDKENFYANEYKLFLFVGSMLGIGSLYCIISFLVYLFFRQKLTLYYWLYTTGAWLFFVAHTGLGFEFFWPEATWWASAARPTTAMTLYLFLLLFAQRFFNMAYTQRVIYFCSNVLVMVFLLLLMTLWSQNPALGLFKDYWYNPDYYDGRGLLIFMKLANLSSFIFLLSVPIISIYYFARYRNYENLWFSVGSSMLLLSGILIILIFAGYLPDNYITQNLPLLANSVETVILSFLLANRFKNIYQQNAQISTELAEQRQRNAIQLLEGQAIERKRLSQELHDGISLMLANIRLRLSMVAEKLHDQRQEVQTLVDELGDVGQDVRQFSHNLSPVLLERHGLGEAIEDLAFRTENAHQGLHVTVTIQGAEEALPTLLKQTLYQITLELLNNIGKHAEATHANIEVFSKEREVQLTVEDNGKGYDLSSQTDGIGIQNIRSRVELFNGTFLVELLAKGMKHTVIIPT